MHPKFRLPRPDNAKLETDYWTNVAMPFYVRHFVDAFVPPAGMSEKDAKLQNDATGQSVKLGAKEYQLMELFLRNPAQILPKETLIERVWGYDSDAEYNNLEVYVSFLRKKLAFIGAGVKLKATRGLGYSLEQA